MGLLASIVAYLSVVAAIVIGFLVSVDALLHHSGRHATDPRSEITTAAKLGSSTIRKAAKQPPNNAEQGAIPRKSTAAEYRRKAELSNTRSGEPQRRTAHQTQKKYWALRRERTAPPGALGYAEEPRFGGAPWW